MQSIARQSVAELGGSLSVLSRQRRDHIKLDRLLQRLDGVQALDRPQLLLEIYRLVFPHAFAEESVLWPVMRRVLRDGHQLTLQVEHEHQEINGLVTQLESLAPGSLEYEQLLSRIIGLLRQDVRDEEDVLLPRLQAQVGRGRLRLLGVVWEAVRWIAPTRAHPIVSRRPPGNVLSALPLALLDRCRDGVDALLHRGAGPAAPVLRALSGTAARASRAVERLPGMQAGEDPSTRVRSGRRISWGAAAFATTAAAALVMLLKNRRARGRSR